MNYSLKTHKEYNDSLTKDEEKENRDTWKYTKRYNQVVDKTNIRKEIY
jgi:hypothetical protein